MKRIVGLCLAAVMFVSIFTGCDNQQKKEIHPEQAFSQYKTLTDLYGTPWRDVLDTLGISNQEIVIYGDHLFGIPKTEVYAGIKFDMKLLFRGDDRHLYGVGYEVEYQYPENEEQLLRDIVTICRQLTEDFGEPSNVNYVFNWVEAYMYEEWNRDIAYWQDIQVLKRLLDNNFTGTLLTWDLTAIQNEAIKGERESINTESNHSVTFSIQISNEEGIRTLVIMY